MNLEKDTVHEEDVLEQIQHFVYAMEEEKSIVEVPSTHHLDFQELPLEWWM